MSVFVSPQSQHYYTDYEDDCEIHRSLTVDRVENGTVHPCEVVAGDRGFEEHLGGVTDSGGNFVPTSGNHRSASEFRRMVRVVNPKPANVRRVHETVIFGGVLYEYYGHALIESMSRLWYFLRDNPEHLRVVFLQTPRAKGTFRELFELLEIPTTRRRSSRSRRSTIASSCRSDRLRLWHLPWRLARSV